MSLFGGQWKPQAMGQIRLRRERDHQQWLVSQMATAMSELRAERNEAHANVRLLNRQVADLTTERDEAQKEEERAKWAVNFMHRKLLPFCDTPMSEADLGYFDKALEEIVELVGDLFDPENSDASIRGE